MLGLVINPSIYGMEEPHKKELRLSSDSTAIPINPFRFKIGFEFQMSGNLFRTYINNDRIQKKPLFIVKSHNTTSASSSQSLWHVEIDGENIEFVTKAFTDQEKHLLEHSLLTIHEAYINLLNFMESHPDKKKIKFNDWVHQLKLPDLDIETTPIANKVKDTLWMRNLKSSEKSKKIRERKPKFSPQVTIQHFLEYTIPLYFGLFGFDNAPIMNSFLVALPNYNTLDTEISRSFAKFQERIRGKSMINSLQDKIKGLVFLHALTLSGMTPNESKRAKTDTEFLLEIEDGFKKYHQIDAKRSTHLMSRRPFSSMFKDINEHNNNINYGAAFIKMIEEGNDIFTKDLNIPENFYRTNYGEQFFGKDGKPLSLRSLDQQIKDNFFQDNKNTINYLLDMGILCTVMIRNFKRTPDIFEQYYAEAINTIENPHSRYILNLENFELQPMQWKYDVLSPPHFLREDNSMGRFKDDNDIDKNYGEVIIEVRNISGVGEWFLKRSNIDEQKKGIFLQNPDNIQEHGTKLFDFLISYEKGNFVDDLNMGLCYALLRKE